MDKHRLYIDWYSENSLGSHLSDHIQKCNNRDDFWTTTDEYNRYLTNEYGTVLRKTKSIRGHVAWYIDFDTEEDLLYFTLKFN